MTDKTALSPIVETYQTNVNRRMKMYKPMRFWGTSAGAPIPAPFCKCSVCENARIVGGKEVRLRSAFRIDKKIMIDIGQDFAAQAIRLGDDLSEVEHFLFTHTHSDHFNYSMFWLRLIASAEPPKHAVKVYLTDDAYSYIDKVLYSTPLLIDKNGEYLKEKNVEFVKLEFNHTYKINDIEVTPLRGAHHTALEKNSANYLIKLSDGRLMYYALDSGYYLDDTFEYLKNFKLDILVGECTFPSIGGEGDGCPVHMDLTSCTATLDKLYENGTIDEQTDIYLSHIEAKGMNHAQLEEYFTNIDRKYNVKIAYDGLSII